MEGPLIAVVESFTGREDVGAGAEALARRLGEPRVVGAEVPAVRAALSGARRPVVVATECVVALATLPWVAEQRPDAKVLWLDTHPDFNTPDTSPSGYVGGMPLAGATGQFDAGVAPLLPAERVVLAGIRDIDPGEGELLAASCARVVDLGAVPEALGDAPVFIHFDCDVIDGYPAAWPAPGGPSADELRDLLQALAARNEIVGLTVTAVAGPPEIPHQIVEPLL
ncbi:MAG TPA: arginase family protein [Capillimicrobium sp.]